MYEPLLIIQTAIKDHGLLAWRSPSWAGNGMGWMLRLAPVRKTTEETRTMRRRTITFATTSSLHIGVFSAAPAELHNKRRDLPDDVRTLPRTCLDPRSSCSSAFCFFALWPFSPASYKRGTGTHICIAKLLWQRLLLLHHHHHQGKKKNCSEPTKLRARKINGTGGSWGAAFFSLHDTCTRLAWDVACCTRAVETSSRKPKRCNCNPFSCAKQIIPIQSNSSSSRILPASRTLGTHLLWTKGTVKRFGTHGTVRAVS